jgi:hypothetical protein
MFLALIRRMISKIVTKLACGALGICSMAWVLAVSVEVDANHPAKGSQAAQNLATDMPQEAPTGFDNLTNGFEDQAAFTKDRTDKFEEVETISDGLGPVYKATNCVSCHQNPVSGSSSQVAELRAGLNSL